MPPMPSSHRATFPSAKRIVFLRITRSLCFCRCVDHDPGQIITKYHPDIGGVMFYPTLTNRHTPTTSSISQQQPFLTSSSGHIEW